ncbi:PAS domain-containing sensor histidine kinase [Variovorax sp. dw_308]|uniref:hybrid sensor histidine kinase/response regulator n=1 Tax=Variovorax sp. dw_308 TaxID=2721546 RepID=UPI001C448811|nr:PAS domain-containing sensor histidine kinase [Variovorax sp. dw_308]
MKPHCTTHPFLTGGGDAARLIAEFDWGRTSAGSIGTWSQTLKASVSMMLQSSVPIALLWGTEGVMIYNDGYAVFAAARHPQLLGMNVRDGWPEVFDFADNLMKVCLAGGTLSYRDQELTLNRTGCAEQVWMNLDYSPLRDEFGQPAGVMAIVLETTAKVRAEQAVRVRDARFQTVAEAMPNHVWAAPPDGSVDWFNHNVSTYTGLPLQQLVCEGWANIVHPEDLADVTQRWQSALAEGSAYEAEARLRRADGAYRWHIARAVPLHDEAGAIIHWVGTNTDIEDQKAAALVLANMNQMLEEQVAERTADRDRMWRLSMDVMVVADFDARILSVNPAWTRLLGWSQTELVGHNFLDLVHPDDRSATLAELARLADGAATFRFENRYRRKDGSYCPFMWTAVPDERFIHAVARDMTTDHEAAEALKRTQAALYQSQKMESVGQLTGGVAHDFNNLLQVISGNLQLLLRTVGAEGSAARYVTNAIAATQRGARLSNQLLAFARRQPLDPKVVNVGRVIAGMEDMLRSTIGDAIEIRTVVSGGLWNSFVDAAQVENALLNLALNARDAMEGSGRLTIEVGNASLDKRYTRDYPDVVAGQFVLLAVTDTGSGMTPEIAARVFEPFFSTKAEGKGTGLGLSMVYGFVRQSGGHVKLYSEPGHGTTVKIYLPRAAGDVSTVAEEVDVLDGGSETVLVAEDDDAVRATVVELLGHLGYEVLEARDAAAALAILKNGAQVDLLFTDVVMPGKLRGPELARKARQLQPGIAVLFTSGYTQNAIVHGGRLDSGVELLGKPYTHDALAKRIRRVLADKARRLR